MIFCMAASFPSNTYICLSQSLSFRAQGQVLAGQIKKVRTDDENTAPGM